MCFQGRGGSLGFPNPIHQGSTRRFLPASVVTPMQVSSGCSYRFSKLAHLHEVLRIYIGRCSTQRSSAGTIEQITLMKRMPLESENVILCNALPASEEPRVIISGSRRHVLAAAGGLGVSFMLPPPARTSSGPAGP